jgi:hypothetical protein
LEEASSRLGRKISPTLYSPDELSSRKKQNNAFVTRALAQPKIWVIGADRDVAA